VQNLHLLLYSFVTLFVSFFLFRSAAGSLAPNKPNMISFIFYKSIILQTFIASILAILYLDNHYAISTVTDSARYYGWLSTNYLMIAMPVGMLLAKFIFTRKVSMKNLLNNYTKQEINLDLIGRNSLKYSIWTFTLISIFACIYTFYIMGYYPPLKIFNVSPEVAAELRGTATREFDGNVYIRNFFAITMMPIMSYIWCFYFIKSKNILDLTVFSLTFVFSISILYYNFAKAPILSYILSYIFVYFMQKVK